jgi:hypothetical protein
MVALAAIGRGLTGADGYQYCTTPSQYQYCLVDNNHHDDHDDGLEIDDRHHVLVLHLHDEAHELDNDTRSTAIGTTTRRTTTTGQKKERRRNIPQAKTGAGNRGAACGALVHLPTRPNGSNGWILRSQVRGLRGAVPGKIDLRRHPLTLWRLGSVTMRPLSESVAL